MNERIDALSEHLADVRERLGRVEGPLEGLQWTRMTNIAFNGSMALSSTVKDLDEARAELEARGVDFDGDTIELPGMVKLAAFVSPDGNRYMLAQSLMD